MAFYGDPPIMPILFPDGDPKKQPPRPPSGVPIYTQFPGTLTPQQYAQLSPPPPPGSSPDYSMLLWLGIGGLVLFAMMGKGK